MVCTLAMFLGIDYEEAEKYFPQIVIENNRGYSWDALEPTVTSYSEIALMHYEFYPPVLFQNPIKFPAILSVQIEKGESTYRHSVFWDGSILFDSALDADPPSTRFPVDIIGIAANEIHLTPILNRKYHARERKFT